MRDYITVMGDTWDSVAFLVYGDEYRAEVLMRANEKYLDTFVFSGGIKLKCPDIEDLEVNSLPEWRK